MTVVALHKTTFVVCQINQVDSITVIGSASDYIVVHGVVVNDTQASNQQFKRSDWVIRIMES